MTVGLKEARIRFVGNPIYLANETVSYVPVKAHTQIVRTDHTQIVDRGKRLNVTGEMFEVYEGGIRGIPVAQEDIIIRIGDQRLTLQKSNTEGKFTFTSLVPADLPVGESTLFFEYIGTSYYDAAINNTLIVIRGQGIVKIDLVELRVNGHEFDTANQSVSQGQEVSGIWRVTDELGNPIQSGDFRAFFAYSAGALAEPIFISAGPLDDFGRYAFNVTWPINDFIVGNRTLIGQFNGSYCQTFISPRTLCVRGGTGNFTLNYTYIAPPEREPDYTLLIVVGAATAAILASAFYFFYYTAKRRQLQRMQRIIRRAADRLVAGNPYAQVIFDAYRALAGYLRTYGYLRKDSETFREFEVALRQALPIDAKAMDEFLSILEEARYSEHEIGEAQRDRAVAALGAVRGSIGALLESGGIPQAPGAVMAPPPPPPPA
jgi:hypothetical protein